MVVYCCVPSCGVVGKSQNLSMHNFTKDPKLQEVWLRRINSDTIKFGQIPKPIPITSTTKICSAHFQKSDLTIFSTKNVLKPDAVPVIFPWSQPAGATGQQGQIDEDEYSGGESSQSASGRKKWSQDENGQSSSSSGDFYFVKEKLNKENQSHQSDFFQ